jgi:hypothetical protein
MIAAEPARRGERIGRRSMTCPFADPSAHGSTQREFRCSRSRYAGAVVRGAAGWMQ